MNKIVVICPGCISNMKNLGVGVVGFDPSTSTQNKTLDL